MRRPLIPSDRPRPVPFGPSTGGRVRAGSAGVVIVLVLGVGLLLASTAAARPTQGAGTAMRGSAGVVQQQPRPWASDGLGWSGVVAAGAFVGLMTVVLGRTYRSSR